MQIRYINRALQRFDSTQVIPTQFVLFTLSVITGSAVLYRDFESTTRSRALKFVGGCFLTFLGVYFITSGRVRHEDEYSEGEEDDEEAGVGFRNTQRYRDSVDDLGEIGARTSKPGETSIEAENLSRSPRASLQSTNSEGDALNTPRGLLSPAISEHEGSLSGDSLSQELTSSPRPQSHTDNPWASPEGTIKATTSDPLVHNSVPATPPGVHTRVAQTPPILFHFPAAPSEDAAQPPNPDSAGRSARPSQPLSELRTPEQRRRITPHTPQSNARNSVTLRLTPGPLITPLSSTLSAVVADSLRRGEGSPGRHQRSRSVRVRRLGSAPLIIGESNDVNPLLDAELSGESHNMGSTAVTTTPSSSRVNSTRDVLQTNTTSTADGITINKKANDDDDPSSTRLRSFSDSLSGGLAWLGGTLRRPRKPETTSSAQSDDNEPSQGHGP